MGEPAVNGELPSSLFFSHLSSYPVVSHSLTTFRNTTPGKASATVADQGYSKLAKPLLPLVTRYLDPLTRAVAKVDSLGNEGLNRVDGHFPIVKETPDAIRGRVYAYFASPLRFADDGSKHLQHTYQAQYRLAGGKGYFAQGKAVVTTGLKATSEGLVWLSAYLVPETQQNGVEVSGAAPGSGPGPAPAVSGPEEEQRAGPSKK